MAAVAFLMSLFALVWAFIAHTVVSQLKTSVRYAWNCKDQGHSFEARYTEAFDHHVFDALLRAAVWERERAVASKKAKLRLYQGEVCRVCGDRKDK